MPWWRVEGGGGRARLMRHSPDGDAPSSPQSASSLPRPRPQTPLTTHHPDHHHHKKFKQPWRRRYSYPRSHRLHRGKFSPCSLRSPTHHRHHHRMLMLAMHSPSRREMMLSHCPMIPTVTCALSFVVSCAAKVQNHYRWRYSKTFMTAWLEIQTCFTNVADGFRIMAAAMRKEIRE